ncbi:uncharacterized protein LOC107264079 isoform X2 [Cephus cinctus]|nr:uncharacterized protein LOC107264079 isoform X2 [Cephus cinctus]XP_024937057.1 uncharacterized protein LOC107264079 isoform X2 [Cephus cinctus]
MEGTQLPMNLRVIVDIVRKAERYSYSSMNMRAMATSLLHRFKFDGVEFHDNLSLIDGIFPFSGTGSQRAKHRIIEELIPGNADSFHWDVLTLEERCALHRAISNTIWNHQSASDDKLCTFGNIEKISGRSMTGDKKKCPIEYGVIITPFGTVATGVVISAIAASLQPQSVNIKMLLPAITVKYSDGFQDSDLQSINYSEDEVDLIVPKHEILLRRSMWFQTLVASSAKLDNVWAATLSGDLAEMAVYQGPIVGSEMAIGATGFWNSTMRPSIFYLTDKHGSLDATRAEVVGGVDGLVIAGNLQGWIDQIHSLRLSQVLDMYYSNRGVSFDKNIKACERARAFLHVAPKTILDEQTYTMTRVLAYRNSIAYMTDEALERMAGYASNAFFNYADKYLFTELHCYNEKEKPHVEMLIAFDGAWSKEYTQDFLAVLLEDTDVSMFGSKMGIIHGTTGELLLNVTNSPAVIHHFISDMTNMTWPSQLNYTRVLETISVYLDNVWEQKSTVRTIGNLGQAVVLLVPLNSLDETEQASAMVKLRQIKSKHPDVHFLYYTSEYNAQIYRKFLLTQEDHLIRSLQIDDITRHLSMVPMTIRPIPCNANSTVGAKNQFEAYISSAQDMTYRLHPAWRNNTMRIIVTVHGVGYGTIKVCSWNKWNNNVERKGFYCKELSGHKEITLTDYSICTKGKSCPDTYYRIQSVSSLMKCTEIDCETPEHVRYIIRAENQFCSGSTSTVFLLPIIIVFTFTSLIL